METSYLFLADGFEEIEALTVVDMMRRAGMNLRTVSITSQPVVIGAHNIPVTVDISIDMVDFDNALWLILPGGMPGSKNLADCTMLVDALKAHAAAGKPLAAICAAPFVLGINGLLSGRKATCYPGFESMLHNAVVTGNMVEIDNNIVTGRGPAAAIDFASAIITRTLGDNKTSEIRSGMLVD